MGMRLSTALLVIAGLACSGSAAWATDYHPGFTCPRPDASDPLTTAICADPAMAKAELTLEKAYYAHRELEGPSAYHRLKVQAVAYDTEMRKACDIPAPDMAAHCRRAPRPATSNTPTSRPRPGHRGSCGPPISKGSATSMRTSPCSRNWLRTG